MKAKLFGAIVLFALLVAAPVKATTYVVSGTTGLDVDFQGTVTTDGTIGVLHAGNILSWTMIVSELIGSIGPPSFVSNNPGAASLFLEGDALSATAGALFWDWTANPGKLVFAYEPAGFSPPFAHVLFNNQAFAGHVLFVDLALGSDPGQYGDGSRLAFEREQIGVAAAVPLPGALVLFATGLGVIGLAAKRRRRKAPTPV